VQTIPELCYTAGHNRSRRQTDIKRPNQRGTTVAYVEERNFAPVAFERSGVRRNRANERADRGVFRARMCQNNRDSRVVPVVFYKNHQTWRMLVNPFQRRS